LDALRATTVFLASKKRTCEETIWAGDLFLPHREKGCILSDVEEGLALSVGFDGFPPFVTAKGNLWVILLKIWNLPASIRTTRRFRLFFAVIEEPKNLDPYLKALCDDVTATEVGVRMQRGLSQAYFFMQAILLTVEADHMGTCKAACFLSPQGNICCWSCWAKGRENARNTTGV